MTPIELSEAADADLDSILDYGIANHGRDVAESYLRLIDAALQRLSEFPELGIQRFDLRPGLRSFPAREHRIYYRFEGKLVLVARILHKSMDAARHL